MKIGRRASPLLCSPPPLTLLPALLMPLLLQLLLCIPLPSCCSCCCGGGVDTGDAMLWLLAVGDCGGDCGNWNCCCDVNELGLAWSGKKLAIELVGDSDSEPVGDARSDPVDMDMGGDIGIGPPVAAAART